MLEDNEVLDEEMSLVKFHNFSSMYLYAVMNSDVALAVTQQGILNTPIKLYESPYTAVLVASNQHDCTRSIVRFAINVVDNIFDELDIGLNENLKNHKIDIMQRKKDCSVTRSLEKLNSKWIIVYQVNSKSSIINAQVIEDY